MPSTVNAWLVFLSNKITIQQFHVSVPKTAVSLDVNQGDILVFADKRIISFARVFRIRETLKDTIFYFDGYLPAKESHELSEYGITSDPENEITRLEFKTYENLLKTSCLISHKDFPTLSGKESEEQEYLRDLLRLAVIDDLLGPANGPYEEIIGMSVRDRYLVGKLAPIENGTFHKTDNPFSQEDAQNKKDDLVELVNKDHIPFDENSKHTDFDDDEEKEIDAEESQSLVPSAMGFTFCVDIQEPSILLSVSWGHYERITSEKINERNGKPYRSWKRIPCGSSMELPLDEGKIDPITPI